ncbi:MAG: hypothetical protein AVDCRST_MAG12-1557 [uncultured Rubrobacteraceae bacterium]|uniref:Gram-positive cocci surface proteins LPxTG domain-containing protein n=1 Tax=uncultured Rubrobacteraceae bacterium TaxID=349277 RepID=A0A6J4S3D3_9ACTN|nr:MAG: hypothetical protein AVDCRST_MAG12-1557 [uncultured Rubrobacteraceae bacterium]
MLVSTLVLASAVSLALAQDKDANVQYVDCSQVQSAIGGQYGNANANAVVESEAIAEVAQELNITQDQVNACLGDIGQNPDGNRDGDGDKEDENGTETEGSREEKEGENAVLAGTDPGGTLPNTGGPSLLALGVALALVAGGTSLIGFSVRR